MTTEQQLPEGWEYAPFNMFFNVVSISDKKISQKEYLDNGKYPVIDQGNLFIGGYSNDESLILKISSPVIVFGDHTKCFKYVSFPFVAGADGIKVLEPKNGIYPKYAYYYCLSIDLTDRGYSRHFAFLKKCQFLIVPLETQQAIVNKIESLFAEIDAGIDSLKTAAQQIQQYRQSLLKNAFNGELTKEWRSKHADTLPSANELLAQIQTAREQHHAQQLADCQTAVSQWEQNGKEGKKPSKPKAPTQAVKFEENFADLPRGWFNFSLDTLAEISGGLTKNAKRGSFKEKVPYLRVANVYANELKLDEIATIGIQENEKARTLLQTNDLLIVEGNGSIEQIGRVAIWNNTINPCYHQNHLIKARCYPFVLPKFALYFLISPMGRERIINVASSTTGLHTLSLTKVANLIIPVCSLAEQTQIVAILESKLTACDQLAAELSKQLKQAALLKQAVLKAAFSGELRE
ncbi:restriction endonuclease subunit S [Haemophilus haemolyticus]|uniref:Type I restriction modification DNA specificity domain-containing protein n=1 Tax=Haemophilus haemolyticus TaxID=726 RepID=A0A1B8PGL0_HAEHA|nr:restriction endonuclease subunit S [Haemophilus haemolyticus]OBX48037.1 hypothetical protein A9Z62_07250 [Haemophilus haemolyticus]